MNLYQSALASSAPSSNIPIGNQSAQNNQQRAGSAVDQQSEALARVNEIRGLWESSNASQQKGLLQQQRDWEESTAHTGTGPLGEYGAATQFASSKTFKMGRPENNKPMGRGGFGMGMYPGLLNSEFYNIITSKDPEGATGQFANPRSVTEELMLSRHNQAKGEIYQREKEELEMIKSGKNKPGTWSPHLAFTRS
jgi:hypothetical protein